MPTNRRPAAGLKAWCLFKSFYFELERVPDPGTRTVWRGWE